MERRAQTLSAVTAVVLVVLVLATFGALQNYGPASTLRRFHVAIESGNFAQAAALTDAPDGPIVPVLIRQTAALMGPARQYRLARMERLPGQVRAVMTYEPRPGLRLAMVWVVTQRGRAWRIDTARTAAILRESSGVPVAP